MPTGLTLADVARTAYLDPTALPAGMSPGLEFHKTYDPPPMTYSNSTHVCEVEVALDTGAIRFGRYVVAEDCGTVLSPVTVVTRAPAISAVRPHNVTSTNVTSSRR